MRLDAAGRRRKVQWTSNIRGPRPGLRGFIGPESKGFAVEAGEGRGHIEEAGCCPPLDFVLLPLSSSEEERLILERERRSARHPTQRRAHRENRFFQSP